MKLVIHGKNVSLDSKYMKVCKTISTTNTKAVLDAIIVEAKSASYIAKKCQMSLANVYRILKVLKEYNLVKISISFDKFGRKTYQYQSLIDTITLS